MTNDREKNPMSTISALLCGGWETTDVAASKPKQSFISGEYYKSCERMNNAGSWDKNPGLDMVRHRAFFSMAASADGIFAFGGCKLTHL